MNAARLIARLDTKPQARRTARRTPWGEILGSAVVLLLAVLFVNSLANNPRLHWSVVGEYMFSSTIVEGVLVTIELSIGCMILAILVGLASALMGQSHSLVLVVLSKLYVWIFRGTPVLVQLIFWYNIALLFPTLSLGPLGSWSMNELVSPTTAAVVGLTLAEGAYMSEIIRAGLLSVDPGQVEAAQSLGMTRRSTLRRVTLPQAVRVIIPPTGNEFITMLKGTSLVAVISVHDLLFSAQSVYNTNYEVAALLIVASCWYLAMTSVATIGQGYVERYFARRM